MDPVDELNARLGIGPSRPCLPITLQRSGYKAVRVLGKGNFGKAYLVFHEARQQYFVVKHINMANMSPRQRKDAHREIVVLQQLDYPNIIRYVEFCEEHPHLYIVMEYADGGDVYTHLKNLRSSVWALGSGGKGGLMEEQVISLFVQTTMAVKYMHDRRLLHRDIKSQNVFLTQNHVVKLGDFGISTVLISTVAMAQTMCGTPCYFSPELCQGKPYNNKSDVWALGVLLYELCTTGRLPFEATTMKRLMDEICTKEPRRIPPSFSEELWNLIQWMMKKDPRQRPDAEQILRSPVLVRAIPSLVKRLSAVDSGCKDGYKHLLSTTETPPPPPPPIRPGMELRPIASPKKRELRQPQPPPLPRVQKQCNIKPEVGKNMISPSEHPSPAAAAAPGAGQFEIFQKGKDDLLAAICHAPEKQQLQRKKEEDALRNALIRPPVPGGAAKYDCPPFQGKLKNVQVGIKPPSEVKGENKPQKEEELPARPGEKVQLPQQKQLKEKPKRSFGRIPLHDLFLRYDENKKRIQKEREERLGAPQNAKNHQPPGILPFRGRISDGVIAPEEKEMKEEIPSHKPLPLSNLLPHRMVCDGSEMKPLHDVAPRQTQNGSGARAVSSEESPKQPNGHNADTNASERFKGDLTIVLREMTQHFDSMQGALGRKRDTSSSRSMSPAPGCPETSQLNPADNNSGPSAHHSSSSFDSDDDNEVGEEFADVMGATLDVQGLRQESPNLVLSIKKFGNTIEKRGVASSPPLLGFEADAEDPVGVQEQMFSGGCLCNGVRFVGDASRIFGSFMCNCLVCSRFSGAMMGVEWLHLPHLPIESILLNIPPATAGNGEEIRDGAPVGKGAAAALTFSRAAAKSVEKADTGEPSADTHRGGEVNATAHSLPPPLAKFVVEVPLNDRNNGDDGAVEGNDEQKNVAVYTVYFCSRCGSTIGMNHNEITGGLLAKAVLSDASLDLLELFQLLVPDGEVVTPQKT